MTHKKVFEPIFDKKGNFVVLGYDPYNYMHDNPAHRALHDLLFDEDGNLNEKFDGNLTDGIQDLEEYIQEQFKTNPEFLPLCDAVHLHFADLSSSATDKQYSTASMFKR